MIQRIEASHCDHNISDEQLAYILGSLDETEGVAIRQVTLPDNLGTVPCGLFGPIMGDEPVTEDEVTYDVRGGRTGSSRLVAREPRQVKTVTVISGPYEDKACVLYTAFGGPAAPREPFEDPCAESVEFWKLHALAV